ncbi:MAG TPA: hypothetical protein VEK33_24930 [Terriglobales bacterium]|nr:hypothetical protein [Terriglobales bacterium]
MSFYARFSPLLQRLAITFLFALIVDTGIGLVSPIASLRLFFPLWGTLIIGWPYLSRKLGSDVPNGAMQRISTPYTFSLKFFPFLFFGFLAFVFFLLLINGAYEKAPMFLVMVGVLAVIGLCSWNVSRRDIVDEVDDCGDYLLIRKRGDEDTVLFSNIINVNFSTDRDGTSARITLTLDSPGKFGKEITFAPPPQIYLGFPSRNKIAEDLLARADKARRR